MKPSLSAGLLVLTLLPLSAISAPILRSVAIPDAVQSEQSIAGFGPLDPAPPAGLTPQQIIDKFAARETVFDEARQNYTFRQTVKVDTLDEDTNKVDGEYQQVTDITFNNDGKREEHVVFAPQNTLERVMMSPADFDEIEHRLPFVLTTEDLPDYDITYLGRQNVDELDTYVFDAAPKSHREKPAATSRARSGSTSRTSRSSSSTARTSPRTHAKATKTSRRPSPPTTSRSTASTGSPPTPRPKASSTSPRGQGYLSQDVHMRTIVKYTDYKQFRAKSRIIYNGDDITNNGQQPANNAPESKTPATAPPK